MSTHWRQQNEIGIAEQKRLDARAERALLVFAIGLAVMLLVLWRIALP